MVYYIIADTFGQVDIYGLNDHRPSGHRANMGNSIGDHWEKLGQKMPHTIAHNYHYHS